MNVVVVVVVVVVEMVVVAVVVVEVVAAIQFPRNQIDPLHTGHFLPLSSSRELF